MLTYKLLLEEAVERFSVQMYRDKHNNWEYVGRVWGVVVTR